MQVLIERCCGLDVHQETVVACVLIGAPGERPRKEIRTFRTMTRDLEALRDWLQELGVTQVGMESTGVYWRPVYAVLEGRFDLIVGNARHIRNVPGRKTDVKDAEWIADLVRHGLIAKSFVPPAPQRELRELLRYRRKLVESQAAERNRLLKLLETANIKLASIPPHGPAYVPATMRAPASRRAGAPTRAMSTCAPCSLAPPHPPRGPRAPTSRTSSTALRPAAAPCAPLSPSLTRSSWLPITCLPRACLTANSAKLTSTRSPRAEPSPTSNDVLSASATTSPSNQRPSPHGPLSTLKLFSWQRFAA
jgi:hypothetical protein